MSVSRKDLVAFAEATVYIDDAAQRDFFRKKCKEIFKTLNPRFKPETYDSYINKRLAK